MVLTLFDVVILTIISISSLLGLYKGMWQIVINSACFIASIVVAILIYPKVKIIFSSYFNNDLIISISSGISSYIFSLLVFTFISASLKIMISPISQGFLDRLLGVVAGFIRGTLISVILFWVAAIFATGAHSKAESAEDLVFNLPKDEYPDWLKNAITTNYLESLLKSIAKLMPEDILSNFKLQGDRDSGKDDIINEIKKKASEIDLPEDINLEDSLPAKE
jgi:uncharacterized membrane protein required for colicin V production